MVGGVYVDGTSVTRYEASVLWTVGTDNGGSILSYRVEAEDEFNLGIWKSVKSKDIWLVPLSPPSPH